MNDHWILTENGKTKKVDLMTWARWFENGEKRRVAQTVVQDATVSTVFLGLNHQFGHGPPLLFETMIFGGKHDDFCDRYSTLEEARRGHDQAVAMVEAQ